MFSAISFGALWFEMPWTLLLYVHVHDSRVEYMPTWKGPMTPWILFDYQAGKKFATIMIFICQRLV